MRFTVDVADDDAGSDNYPYDLFFGDGTDYRHLMTEVADCALQPSSTPTVVPTWRPHVLHRRDVVPHRYAQAGSYTAVVTVSTRALCWGPPYGPEPETVTVSTTVIVNR